MLLLLVNFILKVNIKLKKKKNENKDHGGCDRSTGDAYSFMAPDSTSDIFRGPCTPILY
jgi:hypothetical protein